MANHVVASEIALLRAVNSASSRLQALPLSEDELFEITCDEISQLGFRGGVCWLDDGRDMATVRAVSRPEGFGRSLAEAQELVGLEISDFKFPVAEVEVYDAVIKSGESYFVENTSVVLEQMLLRRLPRAAGWIISRFGGRSGIFAPIVADRTVLGVLNVSGAELSEVHVPAVSALANHLSVALTNVRLFEAQRGAEKLLQTTLEAAVDPFLVVDRAFKVHVSNRAARQIRGFSGASGNLSCHMMFYGCARPRGLDETGGCPAAEVFKSGRAARGLHRLRVGGGRSMDVEVVASPMASADGEVSRVVLTARDLSHQQRAEEDRIRVAKLESMGVLAGGIAHDFNNLLTTIIANIGLLGLEVVDNSAASEALMTAEQACLQAAELTGQLLAFARGGEPVKRVQRIGERVTQAAELAISGSTSQLEMTIAADLWPVEADGSQLAQVVTNITLNAHQAMPEGGQVRLEARNEDIPDGHVPGLSRGPYVALAITDRGPGVPPELRTKVFDPYFSTKSTGSGLGLAASWAIVHRHGGTITISGGPAGGGQFVVYLPALPDAEVPDSKETMSAVAGQGLVLFMDDDAMLLRTGQRLLETLGYHVEIATDGQAAVDRYVDAMARGQRFDAVIMDLTVVGGMGGREAVKLLLSHDPAACVLVSSGYSDDPVMAQHREHGFSGVIPKPYTRAALGKAIRRALSG